MSTPRHRWRPAVTRAVLGALVAMTVAAGCGSDESTAPERQRDRASAPDAPDAADAPAAGASTRDLVDEALTARDANDAARFASLLDDASAACSDAGSAQRLAEVALIADRWAQALADGRPKVQAVTEDQLADLDWAGLAAGCGS